jgi:hypothetical protein
VTVRVGEPRDDSHSAEVFETRPGACLPEHFFACPGRQDFAVTDRKRFHLRLG